MLLNAYNTGIINVLLSYHNEYIDPVNLSSWFTISDCQVFRYDIDNHLSFNKHVESLVSSCNSEIFLLLHDQTKLLDIIIDYKLNFSSHIEYLISKCNSRLLLKGQLKSFGLNSDSLNTFYIFNIRSILLYGTLLGIAFYPWHQKKN